MRRLLALTRPHLRTLLTATFCGVVSLVAVLVIPALTKRLIDDGIGHRHRDLLWPLGLAILGLGLTRSLGNFLRRNLAGTASVRIEAELRERLFAHLQGLPVSFHDEWQSGQLLARATSDLNAIRMFLGYALVFFAYLGTTFLAVAVALLLLSPLLAVLTLALAVPFGLTAYRFNRRMDVIAADSREAVGDVTNVVEESAGGVRVLKAFGQEARAIDRLDGASARLRDINLQMVRVRGFYIPTLALLPNLILGLIFGVGGWQVLDHHLSIGGLVAFTQYLGYLVVPLRFVGWMLAQSQQAVAAGRRVFEILDTQPEIATTRGAPSLPPLSGEVTFDRVSFAYPGSSTEVLHDVSFSVRAGETVAIVGASGAGKSTIAALLPRFFDPTEGRVLVDGVDVRTVAIPSLRRQIGVVFDEAILFSATVGENIAFGRPEATDEEIEAAARAAGAHDFITSLPDGYDTRVGEQGFSLSGGQRQRVALARALLFRPRILVLDDPLSSVDVRTEAEIEANLQEVCRGRTTFVIAHRASTVSMADRVLLLEDGRVVATGTHREMIVGNAGYRQVLAAELDLDDLAEARGQS